MAETAVLIMARSMLGTAVSKAAAAASEEMSLLMGVQKEIWFMKDELETMQAFLVAPEVTKKKDKLVKVWAKQVRDLSYDIEADCLDEFTVHVRSQSLSQQIMKLKDHHRIAVQIRNLKARVEEVSKRNTRYNLIKTEASNTMDETESYLENIRNHSATNIDEAQLVGFDEPKKKLLEMIQVSADDGQRRVISVVGMGGLGKTTLARKIYESKEDIAKNFSCCAWITVSQSYSMRELLQNMIRQLLGDQAVKASQVNEDLASYLRQGLKDKRYFVILDDLWTIEAWNWINEIAFPCTNNKGSRIIVTTRNVEIAKGCSSTESLVYDLKPLQLDDAMELLLRKAQKDHKDLENNENLRDTVTHLANKCGCLPLAILTVGGILASKKIEEWGKFYNQLHSELESNPSLEPVRRIVTLSYNHLPSHLKPCFLYLSIFPEDFEIKRRRLVDRWIAEGLVTARGRIAADEVGERYFQELISRSMILPARVNIEGVVKSCRVHDIVRDTIVSISREENFVYSTDDNVPGGVVGDKFRHVAYHGNSCTNIGVDWSCVRSLTTFGERPMKPAPSLCAPELRMLRTLDVKDAQLRITQKDINNIGLLRHLKYVNAQYYGSGYYGHSNIYALPRSIGKLRSLQVLDLRVSCISALPTKVTKLQSLRSLRCSKNVEFNGFDPSYPLDCMKNVLCLPIMFTPLVDSERRNKTIAEAHMVFSSPFSYPRVSGVRVPRGIGNLKVLQILEVVDLKGTSMKAIKELGELSQLRKLSVTTGRATKGKCEAFSKALVKLVSLRSVHVDSYACDGIGTLEWLGSSLSPPPLLRSLKLSGKIGTTPAWFRNLKQLVKVYLEWTFLKDLEILGELPNLMLLQLCLEAYDGEKLTFRARAFPSLRKLVVSHFIGKWVRVNHVRLEMTEMRFEEDASPRLECIQIEWWKLRSGIIGIKHLPRLKEISLGRYCQVAGLDTLQWEVDQHPNMPVLRLQEDRRYHVLGDLVKSGVEAEAT